ncbi:MAG: GNAT family N-acetyltransferase [Chloroflexota bacterium]
MIETPRLLLRELTLGDVAGLLEIFGDPDATWAYRSTKTRAETEAWIHWATASYAENGWGLWAIERRDDGRFLGDCGPMLQPVEGSLVAELGYHVVRSEWGRGYATEAAIACRDWFFANTDRDRLVSIVWPDNVASRRVAERVHAQMRLFVWEKSGREECLYETFRSPGSSSPGVAGVADMAKSTWGERLGRFIARATVDSRGGLARGG